MKREGFIIPLALIFIVFAMVVSVFLASTSGHLFRTSKDIDDNLIKKYEKLAFISALNSWEKFLKENPVWDEHHLEEVSGSNSTITKTEIIIPNINSENFFTVKMMLFLDNEEYEYTISSTSAYYDPEQFTIEFSASPTEENLGVTFTY